MTKQSYIKLKGYQVYHVTHPDNQARGGSAIIIRDSINHWEECHIQIPEIQLTMVGVSERFIIGGDYYAKHVDWGSRITTTKGRNLRNAITETD